MITLLFKCFAVDAELPRNSAYDMKKAIDRLEAKTTWNKTLHLSDFRIIVSLFAV